MCKIMYNFAVDKHFPNIITLIILKDMNITKRILVLLLALAGIASAASAQFRIGPRVGINVNELRFNKDVFESDNRAGFTGGVQAEFTIPVINLAFDASVMYVRRVSQGTAPANAEADNSAMLNTKSFKNRDYIEIPVNFKYKIGLPVVGKVLCPYVFTGPSFAFLTSRKAITNAYKNKNFDVAWNFGIGLQLFTHLQIGASYGIGMTKTVELVDKNFVGEHIDGKNNYWTVTAAWLF